MRWLAIEAYSSIGGKISRKQLGFSN